MGKKILVVDDSSTVRQQVRIALSQAGYTVVEAVDGMDGQSKIRENSDLAMVICDVNMPRMSGLQMLEAVRKSGCAVGVPIVMLTSEAQPALIRQAKAQGAKGWIVKPFKAEMLVAAVNKLAT
ncbi:MAG: two-component system chemotaxis response regulator CheY [Cognaticolwellia sp.]|jgi:two-component system chemotaxis response regulator CheY